jgi:hypothetical protein
MAVLEAWDLKLPWRLGFGAWNFQSVGRLLGMTTLDMLRRRTNNRPYQPPGKLQSPSFKMAWSAFLELGI